MKMFLRVWILMLTWKAQAQSGKTENVFIITTDGLRWQEVFNGAEPFLLTNPNFVKDTAQTVALYGGSTAEERRRRLMPFFWRVLVGQGQLYGNRVKQSEVNVKNIYKISYPGYNELLTGFADPLPILNKPQYNRNRSILEHLNNLPAYGDSVAAFTSWNVFPFILNKKRNGMVQNCGYSSLHDTAESIRAITEVQEKLEHKYKTRYDALTFFTAKEYIRQHHPRVVFLGLGETDEFAHHGQYDLYLQQINAVDKMIAELWYFVQTDPFYRNNTTFIISTDHGRGRKQNWVRHHALVRGSGEIWLALLGNGIEPLGEMQEVKPVYQNQVAATVAFLLGEEFNPNCTIGKPLVLPTSEQRMAVQDTNHAAIHSFTANPEK
jgi:hypothetical protein